MDYTAAPLEKLIEEFGKFQGVGRKVLPAWPIRC